MAPMRQLFSNTLWTVVTLRSSIWDYRICSNDYYRSAARCLLLEIRSLSFAASSTGHAVDYWSGILKNGVILSRISCLWSGCHPNVKLGKIFYIYLTTVLLKKGKYYLFKQDFTILFILNIFKQDFSQRNFISSGNAHSPFILIEVLGKLKYLYIYI